MNRPNIQVASASIESQPDSIESLTYKTGPSQLRNPDPNLTAHGENPPPLIIRQRSRGIKNRN